MNTKGERTCLVFGAGALGLGFLGAELSSSYRMVYADLPVRANFLDALKHTGRYVINEAGPSIRSVQVTGVSGMVIGTPEGDRESDDVLDRATLVFTAVGEANLAAVAPALARAAARRTPDNPLRILCSENGVEIARQLARLMEKELGEGLQRRARTWDTVMGRMCKTVSPVEAPLHPVASGLDWAVVVESFQGIPVRAEALEGLAQPGEAFQPVSAAVFAALEDVKIMAHNGLHAFLGFLGYLRGKTYYPQLRQDAHLMRMARDLLLEEIGEALFRKHGAALDRNYYLNYVPSIIRRITCPGLCDTIARGIRGTMRKLEPWERMVYGIHTVIAQGIRPEIYAHGLAAGVLVAQQLGETELEFSEVLTIHCKLDPVEEADLMALVEEKRGLVDKEP